MLKSKECQVQFNENRLSRDTINEFELQSKEKVESKKSDDTFLKRAMKYMGYVYERAFEATTIVLTTQVAFSRMGRAEGLSMPEATALAPMGSDNAMKPPALPESRAKVISENLREPYVPPGGFSSYNGLGVKDIWRNAYKEYVEGVEGASKGLHQGEAQNAHDGETSSGQAKPNKHESRKLLSMNEKKIATVQALQSFEKRLNDQKVRERSLLESNSGSAHRRLLQESSNINPSAYTSTQLTPTEAQAQLNKSQAFQDATQYLGIQPDWNTLNAYAYQSTADTTDKGVIAIYPSEGYSTTFLVINNGGTPALLGDFGLQSEEQASLTWLTPKGVPFAAQFRLNGWGGNGPGEVLVSGDIKWGNSTFSPACFIHGLGWADNAALIGGFSDSCAKNCIMSLGKDQSSCYDDCILYNGPIGMYTAKRCLAAGSDDPYACLSVSGAAIPEVQLWPYMMKISGEVYVRNNCSWGLDFVEPYVDFNYVCPPRTCPPGRAYYSLDNRTRGGDDAVVLNPGERKPFLNYNIFVYCSTLDGTEEVNNISLPTDVNVNLKAFGGTPWVGNEYYRTVYSPSINFHVYDASMYPDLHPYPALPSACGDNDPNCTQLCARHPEADIPSSTMPAPFLKSPPPPPEVRPPSPPEVPASPLKSPPPPPEVRQPSPPEAPVSPLESPPPPPEVRPPSPPEVPASPLKSPPPPPEVRQPSPPEAPVSPLESPPPPPEVRPPSPSKAHTRSSALVWGLIGGGAVGVAALGVGGIAWHRRRKRVVINPIEPDPDIRL
jgi:hypothetical protein